MNPRYPIYVISKGRWESRLTVKALLERDIPFKIVIEPQEFNEYAAVIDKRKILVLPFSNLGQGSIPARNWVWEHAIEHGAKWHWILDDNIRAFLRLYRNVKYYTASGTTFRVIEDFVNRYTNIGQAGMQYHMFAPRKNKNVRPIILNTRIYSCILIRNDLPYRWRGRYNEDTDLSLRILKDGLCTVLFQAFLAVKQATMTMKGGNTDELYKADGRIEMALSLQRQHPDVVTVVKKFRRLQHQVDYRPFKVNRLIPRPGLSVSATPDEYGMVCVERAEQELKHEQVENKGRHAKGGHARRKQNLASKVAGQESHRRRD